MFTDYLTKNVEAFPVPNQTTETVSRILVNEIISRHGVCEELLTDKGYNFTAKEFRVLCNGKAMVR